MSTSVDQGARAATRAALAIAPGVMLAGFAGGIAFPIVPLVALDAHLPLPFIGVILAANRIARIVASPLVGALTDRLGARRTFIAGLVLQLAVMALYAEGVASGHPGVFFLLARVLHGPSSAAVGVAGQALALRAGGGAHGGRVGGLVRAAMMLGVPLGLVAGGVLADLLGMTATFGIAMLALVVAIGSAVVLLSDLPATMRRERLAETLRALGHGGLAAIGALSFAAFFAAHGVMMTMLPLLVHDRALSILHLGAQGSGAVAMGWMMVAIAAGSAVAGPLGDRWHAHGRIAALGVIGLIPGLVLAGAARTPGGLLAAVTLVGLGAAALGPSLLALIGEQVGKEDQGTAIGLIQLCGDLGSLLGPLVGTLLVGAELGRPYYASAAIVACVLPVAGWLARRERAALPAVQVNRTT